MMVTVLIKFQQIPPEFGPSDKSPTGQQGQHQHLGVYCAVQSNLSYAFCHTFSCSNSNLKYIWLYIYPFLILNHGYKKLYALKSLDFTISCTSFLFSTYLSAQNWLLPVDCWVSKIFLFSSLEFWGFIQPKLLWGYTENKLNVGCVNYVATMVKHWTLTYKAFWGLCGRSWLASSWTVHPGDMSGLRDIFQMSIWPCSCTLTDPTITEPSIHSLSNRNSNTEWRCYSPL